MFPRKGAATTAIHSFLKLNGNRNGKNGPQRRFRAFGVGNPSPNP